MDALAEMLVAETLTRVLYPDDSTVSGQALRFLQEYFLVACSRADLVRRFRRANTAWGGPADPDDLEAFWGESPRADVKPRAQGMPNSFAGLAEQASPAIVSTVQSGTDQPIQ